MAQIDYDEDDTLDDSASPQWRRRIVIWILAAIGLGLGFLIPYSLYLNHEVGQRFGQLRQAVRVLPSKALLAAKASTNWR